MNAAAQLILKSSLPTFREHGETIAGVFYEDLFLSNPHLVPMFSMKRQVEGIQAKRFADALVAYVESLDTSEADTLPLHSASQRHVAKGVRPEHYDLFRKHFLRAMMTVLRESAPPEVIAAWGQALEELSHTMIAREKTVKQELREQIPIAELAV